MNLALLLVLAGASLEYSGPISNKAATSEYQFSTYKVGDKLSCAVDGANLRKGPSTDGEPLGQVLLAAEVKVLGVGEPVRVQDRVDRWYEVETPAGRGYLFGNTLTTLAWTIDLDGDGSPEKIAVSWSAKMTPVVRIEGRSLAAAPVRLSQSGKTKGGVLEAELQKGARTGLINLRVCQSSKCQRAVVLYDGKDVWASSGVAEHKGTSTTTLRDGGVAIGDELTLFVPGSGGRLRKASCAAPCRVGGWLEREKPRDLVTLEIEEEPRAPSMAGPCQDIGFVRGGLHDGKRVVSCRMVDGGKAGPEYLEDNRFVVEKDETWTSISALNEDIRAAAKRAGQKVRGGKAIVLGGLDAPEVLRSDSFGQLRLKRLHTGSFSELVTKPGWVDARLGQIFIGEHGAILPHVSTGFWSWDYTELRGELVGVPEPGAYVLTDNWTGASSTRVVEVDRKTLERVGEIKFGGDRHPLLKPKDASNDLYVGMLAWHESAYQMGWRPERAIPRSAADFHKANGLYVVVDPMGRTLQLTKRELVPPLLAEPMIYLYPTVEAEIELHVDGVGFHRSLPKAKGTGWRVRANPEGQLLVGEERHDRLFWDGYGRDLPLPNAGYRVPREDAETFLTTLAHEHGLIGRELVDFVEAWVSRLREYTMAEVRVVDQDALNALVPLRTTPAADTLIRLYIDVRAATTGPLATPAAPAAKTREGFVLVEWGGVAR